MLPRIPGGAPGRHRERHRRAGRRPAHARGRRERVPGRRGVHARRRSRRGAGLPGRVKASDLARGARDAAAGLGRRPAGLDRGAAAVRCRMRSSRVSATRRSLPTIRCAPCAWSVRRRSRSSSSARTRIRPPATPTDWRFRPGAAGRARWRGCSSCWPTPRPGFVAPESWTLDAWARQGVLLLNPVLTVEIGRTGSHLDCGWQALTREIVNYLSRRASPPVFLLWGAKARAFWAGAKAEDSSAQVADDASPLVRLRPLVHGRGQPFRRHGPPRRLVGDRHVTAQACYSPGFVSEGCPSG